MAIYSLQLDTTVTTTGAACMDIRAGTANSPKVMEIAINLKAATASTYGLTRASNNPTQTSPVLVQAENPADPAGVTGSALSWSVAPTTAGNYLRRIGFPNVIGNGIIWTFPRGLVLTNGAVANATLLIWNLATNGNLTGIWYIVDE